MQRLKRKVTGYFKWRNLELQNLSKQGIEAADDYAELYILVRLLRMVPSAQPRHTTKTGHVDFFRVAASPSREWNNVSFFEVTNSQNQRLGIRTGLRVLCVDDGDVELDLVIVQTNGLVPPVRSSDVSSAAESKAHAGHISATVANEVIGKAARVFGLPVAMHRSQRPVERYCLVSLDGCSAGADTALAYQKIARRRFWRDLDGFLRETLDALGVAK
jgi:hypothetical protein